MVEKRYDLVVIGGGPGGYVAAIRAAQLGLKVACVEKRSTLGGTCLNVGCIPSKALLHSSERFSEAQNHFEEHGISFKDLRVDVSKMLARKDKVVRELTAGIDYLLKKNKIDRFEGIGSITKTKDVVVNQGKKEAQTLQTKNILIATGSESMPLKGVDIDESQIVSSTGALSLSKVPKHLVVIGGGYIGLEMGAVWQRLGATVTVIEYMDRIVPTMDHEVGAQLMKILKKGGMNFKLGYQVLKAEKKGKDVAVTYKAVKGSDAPETLTCDTLLVSIGRRPYTGGLGLENVGVELDERGRIKVDDRFKTNVEGIYAIGDVIPGPMLAHKAEEEGVICVEMLAGQAGHIDYNLIPSVIYTYPEVASVGKTEEQLKSEGIEYRVGKFPFTANSRAKATGETDGFVKFLTHKETDRILGVHMIGPYAGTMIAEAVLAMEFGASAEDIARTCHAHPTHNEAVKEAALAANGRVIHI